MSWESLEDIKYQPLEPDPPISKAWWVALVLSIAVFAGAVGCRLWQSYSWTGN